MNGSLGGSPKGSQCCWFPFPFSKSSFEHCAPYVASSHGASKMWSSFGFMMSSISLNLYQREAFSSHRLTAFYFFGPLSDDIYQLWVLATTRAH